MTDPIHNTTKGVSSDDWETPRRLFTIAARAFGPFDLDAAATRQTALAPYYLGPDHRDPTRRDALRLDDWWRGLDDAQAAWLNPPYSRAAGPLGAWMRKAAEQATDGRRVVVLSKVDTSTEWFAFAFKHAAQIVFLQPRVIHTLGGESVGTPPWGSCLVVFTGAKPATINVGRWK